MTEDQEIRARAIEIALTALHGPPGMRAIPVIERYIRDGLEEGESLEQQIMDARSGGATR